MKRAWVLPGAVILVFSVLLPLLFLSFHLLPFGILEGLSLGIDIFCCCGGCLPFFLLGAGLVIFGLISTDGDGKAR